VLALEFKHHARRIGMFISEGRAPITEIQDRLIELYVQQDEARRAEDRDRARELQVEIDKAAAQREEIRR
jgi:molybdenum-dependent DNA-binding transcriptional regulator ModE